MKILFADDHLLFADAIIALLKLENDCADVTHAADLPEAMSIASRSDIFDVVILDLRMPGMRGVQGVAKFLESYAETPLILISGAATASEVDQAISMGAAGFVSKFLPGREFVDQIKGILSGIALDPSQRAGASPTRNEDSLTNREIEIVRLVADGLSNDEISLRLTIALPTVKSHIQSIMSKSGARNRTEIAISAIKNSMI
jgi:two-component system nitrate/nitrite response regulator NarL